MGGVSTLLVIENDLRSYQAISLPFYPEKGAIMLYSTLVMPYQSNKKSDSVVIFDTIRLNITKVVLLSNTLNHISEKEGKLVCLEDCGVIELLDLESMEVDKMFKLDASL